MFLIIIQAIQTIYSIIIYFIKEKKYILLNTAIGSLISILMYVFLGEINALMASAIICIRNIVYIWKDKYKTNIPFYLCLIAHLVGGIFALTIDTNLNILSFIPMATSLLICFCNWFSNEEAMRIASIIANILWLIFNMYYELYGAGLLCLIGITTPYMAYIYYKKQKIIADFMED